MLRDLTAAPAALDGAPPGRLDPAMGRLENIIARNRRPNRTMNERLIVSMVLGAIVLVIVALAVFTDLGVPPEPREAGDAHEARDAREAPAAPAAPSRGERVDGVLLRSPPARPAPPERR